ncbi:MAG: hypothetical protein N3D15_06100 [Syntrophorhabdaceae bacterium]|nr:hypothetical protein [Syntrophorhabdaceae bacterium]
MSLFSKKKDKKGMLSKMRPKRCIKRLKRSLLTIEENFSLPKEEKKSRR